MASGRIHVHTHTHLHVGAYLDGARCIFLVVLVGKNRFALRKQRRLRRPTRADVVVAFIFRGELYTPWSGRSWGWRRRPRTKTPMQQTSVSGSQPPPYSNHRTQTRTHTPTCTQANTHAQHARPETHSPAIFASACCLQVHVHMYMR